MKKILTLAAIATIGLASFSSCKKSSSDPTGNYNCICTITSGGTTVYDTTTLNNQKKSVATAACNQSQSSSGGTITCKLQ